MENDYKPTTKEVISEVFKGAKETFSKDNFRKFGKDAKDFGIMAGSAGGVIVTIPYAVPSYVRWFKDSKGESGNFTNAEKIGAYIGIIGAMVIDAWQILYYAHLVEDYPEVLAIPVVTNMASGLYEVARYSYKKAKQSLIEKHNLESLFE